MNEVEIMLKLLILPYILKLLLRIFPENYSDCRLFTQLTVHRIERSPQPCMFPGENCLECIVGTPVVVIDRLEIVTPGKYPPAIPELFVNVRAQQFYAMRYCEFFRILIQIVEEWCGLDHRYEITLKVENESSYLSAGYCVLDNILRNFESAVLE